MITNQQQAKWGQSRIKGIPTMRIALPGGIAIAIGYGLLYKLAQSPTDPLWWVSGLIFGLFLAPCAVVLIATLIVDRSTKKGAVRNPMASIESTWGYKAAWYSFFATLAACGVGSVVAEWLKHNAVSHVLLGVAGFMAVSFWIAYLVQKLRS